LLDFLRGIDFSFAKTRTELVDRDVDVYDFIGTLEKAIGNRLANLRAGGTGDGIVQCLKMLNVHRCHHVDASIQQLENIFVTFAIA